jgi:hypothetical protein
MYRYGIGQVLFDDTIILIVIGFHMFNITIDHFQENAVFIALPMYRISSIAGRSSVFLG